MAAIFLPKIFLPQTPLLLKRRIEGGVRANFSDELCSGPLFFIGLTVNLDS